MRHLDALEARFGPEFAQGGTCFISARLDDLGRVAHLSDVHRLVLGERAGGRSLLAAAIAGVMARAQFEEAASSEDVVLEMWGKWALLAALAGITCLTRADVGDVVAAGGAELAAALLEECRSVAEAAGYPPRPTSLRFARDRFTDPASTMTASMLADLEQGELTEADHILGELSRREGNAAERVGPSCGWPSSPSRPRRRGRLASRGRHGREGHWGGPAEPDVSPAGGAS